MKRGFLGSTEVDNFGYWTDGKSSHELKCNESILYSEIDLCQSEALHCKTKADLQKRYSHMDRMYLCLKAIEFCGDNDDLLRCAGTIIGNMETTGCFAIDFDSVEEENQYLDRLVDQLKYELSNDEIVVTNKTFEDWFEENVVAYNYYNTPNGKSKKMPPFMGATTGTDDYHAKLKESATALMYYGANKNNLYEGCRNEDELTQKIFAQGKAVEWFASSGTNMTQKSILNVIRSGIMEKTGMTQEEAIYQFREEAVDHNGLKGLGIAPVVIATIISVACAIIGQVISAIVAYRREKRAYEYEKEQECPYDPAYDAPSYDDFVARAKGTMDEILSESSGLSNTELYAVLGIAGMGVVGGIYMMMSKKNKND